MKQVLMLALALVSVPAFAWHHPGHVRHYHHGHVYDSGYDSDRAIGPARGAYNFTARGASCEGARSSVYSHGSIILYYGPDLYTRVVRDGSFCSHEQVLEPFWVGGCMVGYTCRDNGGY